MSVRCGGARPRGFTLIEILVALAVVAVALGAIVWEAGQNAAAATRLQERTLAEWVALNRIAEIQLGGQWPAMGVERGSALMANREWFWTVTVSSTEDQDMRRLDVAVRTGAAAARPAATLIAYLGRPAP